MKKTSYSTLLFDADMTLFDFDSAEREAFGVVMRRNNVGFTEEDYLRYRKINAALWDKYGRGEIEKDFLQVERFASFLRTVGNPGGLDASMINRQYIDALADSSTLLDGAEESCAKLSAVYDLYIVTNGVSRTQKKRFANSSIRQYIKDIFVSEDAGAPKPMETYFDYVFSRIGEERRAGSVIIGDSLTTDIAGGKRAGIGTILFCPSEKLPDGISSPDAAVPDYIVHGHAELRKLLLDTGDAD